MKLYCFFAQLALLFAVMALFLCRTGRVSAPRLYGSHRSHGLGYDLSPNHSHLLPCLRYCLFILKANRRLKGGQPEFSI
jgi:hypothetical protein